MAWTIEFEAAAKKELAALDAVSSRRIIRFLVERVAVSSDPRHNAEQLRGSKFERLWRYRVGDYRVICQIRDAALVILVVRIGHRKQVYR